MNSRRKRRLLPSPSMVVAVLALIAALTGSAVALQGKGSVKTDDIAKQAVTGSKIAKNAVKGKTVKRGGIKGANIKDGTIDARDLNVYKSETAAEQTSTDSGPALDLGGPAVSVTVKQGDLVQIFAQVEANSLGGGANGKAQVHLYEPTFLPDSPRIMEIPTSAGFQFRQTAPGSGDLDGAVSPTRGGFLTLAPPPGTYTFSLRYSVGGGSTALFRNRSLYAGIVR